MRWKCILRRWWLLPAAVPALYLLAALIGSLVPVNRGWSEPERGVTIYIADNGIHARPHPAGQRRRGSTGRR